MPNFDFSNKKIPINYSPEEERPVNIGIGRNKQTNQEFEDIDFLFPGMEDKLSVKTEPEYKEGVIDTVNQAYETGRPDVDIMKGLVNDSFDIDEIERLENLKDNYKDTFNQYVIKYLNINNVNEREKRRMWYSNIQNNLETLFELLETSDKEEEIKNIINEIALLIQPAINEGARKSLDKYL